MIPVDYITEWRQHAPWTTDAQVEQDLVLSRAIVEIFGDASVAAGLAFRGATAIYKLHLRPAARYSEDIDLVQIRPGPIGKLMNAVRARLDPWLGTPKWDLRRGTVVLVYRFDSEDRPALPLRLKVEINSREHLTTLGHVELPFRVQSRWFQGEAAVTTFAMNELAATKLRALYQRKKGRDLFDLWLALDRGLLDEDAVVRCFLEYMRHGRLSVSRAELEANLAGKAANQGFLDDVRPLITSTLEYDHRLAFQVVGSRLVSKLPGAPWRGGGGASPEAPRPKRPRRS